MKARRWAQDLGFVLRFLPASLLPLAIMAWAAGLNPADPQTQRAVLLSALASVIMVALVYILYQRKLQVESYKDELERMVRTDDLTQLLNRRALTEDLDAGLADRGVLLLMDLDGFKQVNDQVGHDAGDALLRIFATVVRENTRSSRSDRSYRIGGDEFVVVLADIDVDQAQQIASRVIGRFQAAGAQTAQGVPIGVSVGAAQRIAGESAEQWLKRADAVMYAAKRKGGGLEWAS